MILFSEIQTQALSRNYGRVRAEGLIPHAPIAYSISRASTTQKLLLGTPPFPILRTCSADPRCFYNFYLGKRVTFVYRAHWGIRSTKITVIWGKLTRPHGMHFQWESYDLRFLNKVAEQLCVVRAQFRRIYPPKSFGASTEMMLYPSSIELFSGSRRWIGIGIVESAAGRM